MFLHSSLLTAAIATAILIEAIPFLPANITPSAPGNLETHSSAIAQAEPDTCHRPALSKNPADCADSGTSLEQ